MFRSKKCATLEMRLARVRQMCSNTEDENQQMRAKIDELRRLISCQKESYMTCQTKMRRIQAEQAEDLLHSDNVLFEKEIISRKIDEILEKNALEVGWSAFFSTESVVRSLCCLTCVCIAGRGGGKEAHGAHGVHRQGGQGV